MDIYKNKKIKKLVQSRGRALKTISPPKKIKFISSRCCDANLPHNVTFPTLSIRLIFQAAIMPSRIHRQTFFMTFILPLAIDPTPRAGAGARVFVIMKGRVGRRLAIGFGGRGAEEPWGEAFEKGFEGGQTGAYYCYVDLDCTVWKKERGLVSQ